MTDGGAETDRERALRLTAAHVAPHRVAVWDAFGTQLVIGRRKGYRLWDLSGHELIDMHLNGGTFLPVVTSEPASTDPRRDRLNPTTVLVSRRRYNSRAAAPSAARSTLS